MFGFLKPKQRSNTKVFYVSKNGGETDGTISFKQFKDGLSFEKAPINQICIYPNKYLIQFSYKIADNYNSIIEYNFSSNPEIFKDATKEIITDSKSSPQRQSFTPIKPPSLRQSPTTVKPPIGKKSDEDIKTYLKENKSNIKRIQLNKDTLIITHSNDNIQTFLFESNNFNNLRNFINSDEIATVTPTIERFILGIKQAWGGGKKIKASKPKATKKK